MISLEIKVDELEHDLDIYFLFPDCVDTVILYEHQAPKGCKYIYGNGGDIRVFNVYKTESSDRFIPIVLFDSTGMSQFWFAKASELNRYTVS